MQLYHNYIYYHSHAYTLPAWNDQAQTLSLHVLYGCSGVTDGHFTPYKLAPEIPLEELRSPMSDLMSLVMVAELILLYMPQLGQQFKTCIPKTCGDPWSCKKCEKTWYMTI